jgi:excisionase family DNA binding protein
MRTENIESESVSPADIAASFGWVAPPGAGPVAAPAASPEGMPQWPGKPAPAGLSGFSGAPARRTDGRQLDGRSRLLVVTYGMTVYLTVREVATMARCEHKSVRRAIAAGRLPALQPANKLLIREDDAYAWIEGRPATTTDSALNIRSTLSRRGPAPASQRPGSVADLREIERKVVQA